MGQKEMVLMLRDMTTGTPWRLIVLFGLPLLAGNVFQQAYNLADTIIIGVLMNLVPGIVITTFMRDMMAGDVVAGLIRFCESLLVATAIALGVGAALMVPRLLFGV